VAYSRNVATFVRSPGPIVHFPTVSVGLSQGSAPEPESRGAVALPTSLEGSTESDIPVSIGPENRGQYRFQPVTLKP
jgi:hypothetical protein